VVWFDSNGLVTTLLYFILLCMAGSSSIYIRILNEGIEVLNLYISVLHFCVFVFFRFIKKVPAKLFFNPVLTFPSQQ